MKRLLALLALCGCTEHGKSPAPDAPIAPPDAFMFPMVDAPPATNPGFTLPAQVVAAWTETSPGTFQAATLDLSCLRAVRNDAATTTAVTVTATIRDFQSGNLVPGAMVSAFAGTSISTTFGTATADSNGVATLTIPAGTQRFGFAINETNSRPTRIFDKLLAPSTAAQSITLRALSTATAQTLPALIGVSATPNRSIVLGTMVDCQGHTLSNVIATVSAFPGVPSHFAGVDTYYFSESVGLPVRHTQQPASSKNGEFMVIEVPTALGAHIQVWGFRNTTEQSTQMLSLLAELGVPMPAGSALFTDHDPRATQ